MIDYATASSIRLGDVSLFHVKICGITNPADARHACDAGADAIGLNFYTKSLRSVTVEQASQVLDACGSIAKVGVFVNQSPDEIIPLVKQLELTHIQLHGDEQPDCLDALCSYPVIRAVRIPPAENSLEVVDRTQREIDRWASAGVRSILLDAAADGHYGGTGHRLSWDLVPKLKCPVHLVLAGGLNRDNVSQAIRIAKPNAVDVASGVESFPGKKDLEQMSQFIDSAREQFKRLHHGE